MRPRILLVAATEHETAYLREHLELKIDANNIWKKELTNGDICLLHTGIGMVNTAFALGAYLATNRVSVAINFGIGGSFEREIEIGEVVEVVKDSFSELGADSPEGFLDLSQMGFSLLKLEGRNYFNTLVNITSKNTSIRRVSAITVNQVTGRESVGRALYKRWKCQVETMEGAAFFHAMIKYQIPFFAYRGISNYIEDRNRANWNIPLAAKNVQVFVIQKVKQILEHLPNSY